MTTTTNRGRLLAHKLAPWIGSTHAIDATCSLIARHATTYAHIQEAWCNDEMSEQTADRLAAKEARLERRIVDLVADLPAADDGPWSVRFDGDPRGWVVRIKAPEHAGAYDGVGVA